MTSNYTPPTLSPLLMPKTLDWRDVRDRCIHSNARIIAPATKPETQSMTIIIPGLPFHLPPLEAHAGDPHNYVTVENVLDYLYHALHLRRLEDHEFALVYSRYYQTAIDSCIERENPSNHDLMDAQEFIRTHLRCIDFVRGRFTYGGLRRQRDASNANVWILHLVKYTTTDSIYTHPYFEPGKILWDMAGRPRPASTTGEEILWKPTSPMHITHASSKFAIEIPVEPTTDSKPPLPLFSVLTAIHCAMKVRLSDEDWPLWLPKNASDGRKVLKHMYPDGVGEKSKVFLDTLGGEGRRFLGIWHDRAPDGKHIYTLLTQPSRRPVPTIHHRLAPGTLKWDMRLDVSLKKDAAWMEEPATEPGRRYMSVVLDIIPGTKWTLNVFAPYGVPHITVRRLFMTVFKFLMIDPLKTSMKGLPKPLRHRLVRVAENRKSFTAPKRAAPKEPSTPPPHIKFGDKSLVQHMPPKIDVAFAFSEAKIKEAQMLHRRKYAGKQPSFKRIDALDDNKCIGFKHRISEIGEDEWLLCFANAY